MYVSNIVVKNWKVRIKKNKLPKFESIFKKERSQIFAARQRIRVERFKTSTMGRSHTRQNETNDNIDAYSS